MPYEITISGINTKFNKCIDWVTCKVDTPATSNARTNYAGNYMNISGFIGTDEATIDLYQWAILPINESNVCRNVELTVKDANDNVIEKVSFPNAFVQYYKESYLRDKGLGKFDLQLKQRIDKNGDIKVSNDSSDENLLGKTTASGIFDKVVNDTLEKKTKDWEEIKKEKSKELDKFVKEVNEKNLELEVNGERTFAKAAIMFDVNNPSCEGMAVPGNYKENPWILDKEECFSRELFEGKFENNYEKYYNYLMSQEYLESLPNELYVKKGTNKDKVIREMKKLTDKIEEVKKAAGVAKKGEKNIFGQYSFEKNWNVENCAEVWAARKAILNGAEFDNLAFKCVHTSDSTYAMPCKNCRRTFKNQVNIGKGK